MAFTVPETLPVIEQLISASGTIVARFAAAVVVGGVEYVFAATSLLVLVAFLATSEHGGDVAGYLYYFSIKD